LLSAELKPKGPDGPVPRPKAFYKNEKRMNETEPQRKVHPTSQEGSIDHEKQKGEKASGIRQQ
jgi:hypothetical protein